MRVVIVRDLPGESSSMDVYADGVVSGLKRVRPDWEIHQVAAKPVRIALPLLKGMSKYAERYWRYPVAISKERGDIFHIIDHSYGHVAYWLRRSSIPTVATCHDLINFIYPENLRNRARIPLLSMTAWRFAVSGLRHADYVIADSQNTANDLKRLLRISDHRIKVVPAGVDHTVFSTSCSKDVTEALRQRYGISPNTMCVLHVGGVDARKNMNTILSVMAALRSDGLFACLWKVGEDFTAEQRALIARHDLANSVIYLGKMERRHLVLAYNSADVLLFPSIYEGFGLPVLEAMACGTPVITSNTSSLPEVAGNAAILVKPTDVESIARALKKIHLDSRCRHELILKGLARAGQFSWERVAEGVANVYEEVVANQCVS